MAEPSPKDPRVDTFLTGAFKIDRQASIKSNLCIAKPIGCGGEAEKFRDALSAKEYTISGLCQKCQDQVYGV